MFISWNGGRIWSPFQLNLPVTPITDLRIHQGDLIAATSGRAFWILDDLGLLQQYNKDLPAFHVYPPEKAYLANGKSELNKTNPDFTGMDNHHGVNPANGITVYYQLPEVKSGEVLTLEIRDAAGNTVRRFSS